MKFIREEESTSYKVYPKEKASGKELPKPPDDAFRVKMRGMKPEIPESSVLFDGGVKKVLLGLGHELVVSSWASIAGGNITRHIGCFVLTPYVDFLKKRGFQPMLLVDYSSNKNNATRITATIVDLNGVMLLWGSPCRWQHTKKIQTFDADTWLSSTIPEALSQIYRYETMLEIMKDCLSYETGNHLLMQLAKEKILRWGALEDCSKSWSLEGSRDGLSFLISISRALRKCPPQIHLEALEKTRDFLAKELLIHFYIEGDDDNAQRMIDEGIVRFVDEPNRRAEKDFAMSVFLQKREKNDR